MYDLPQAGWSEPVVGVLKYQEIAVSGCRTAIELLGPAASSAHDLGAFLSSDGWRTVAAPAVRNNDFIGPGRERAGYRPSHQVGFVDRWDDYGQPHGVLPESLMLPDLTDAIDRSHRYHFAFRPLKVEVAQQLAMIFAGPSVMMTAT